jgi:hypothetical protein
MSDARGSLGSELAATLPTQNAEGPFTTRISRRLDAWFCFALITDAVARDGWPEQSSSS